mgnify:CR=1 FL=1
MKKEPGSEVDSLASRVIGAAIEVHRHLGAGFLESVYQQSLAIEMLNRGIGFEQEAPIGLTYKGHRVGEAKLDFLIDKQLIVELKAVDAIHPIYHAQVMNYLRATNLSLGLLINFNTTVLKDGIKRIVVSN